MSLMNSPSFQQALKQDILFNSRSNVYSTEANSLRSTTDSMPCNQPYNQSYIKQEYIQQTKTKSILPASNWLLVGLVIVIILLCPFMYSKLSNKQLSQTFLTVQEQSKLLELIKPIKISQFSLKYSESGPEKKTEALNRVLEDSDQYFIGALSTNQGKRHIFGVYGHKKHPERSFIFSLNHGTISKIQKKYFVLEMIPGNNGPAFGKMDIIFFENSSGNCKSHFCYSFQCPPGIRYGTTQANEYLAGRHNFRVDSMFVYSGK